MTPSVNKQRDQDVGFALRKGEQLGMQAWLAVLIVELRPEAVSRLSSHNPGTVTSASQLAYAKTPILRKPQPVGQGPGRFFPKHKLPPHIRTNRRTTSRNGRGVSKAARATSSGSGQSSAVHPIERLQGFWYKGG